MLSHLPRVSREGNYFAHVLNWLQVRSSCCFWCLPPWLRRILVPGPHNRELGVPMANPAERKGETQMREKIKGTLGAIWCCCRPKSSVWNEQTQGHSLLQPPTTLQPFFLSQPLESATQLSSASRTGQHRFLSLVPYH
ncbi:uncharacterized protein [Pseudorca crassidens]|uniref:uncharacterized protein isoform X6 n=1 Tax=Pseudorca crassidens TaxID=82174 RepID=UPI00352D9AE0